MPLLSPVTLPSTVLFLPHMLTHFNRQTANVYAAVPPPQSEGVTIRPAVTYEQISIAPAPNHDATVRRLGELVDQIDGTKVKHYVRKIMTCKRTRLKRPKIFLFRM